jgi:hypothetical protein
MNNSRVFVGVAIVCVVSLAVPTRAQEAPKQHPAVIDMHLHALPAKGWPGGPSFLCPGMDFAAYDPGTKWDPDHSWDNCPNLSTRSRLTKSYSAKFSRSWIATM